ncbi:MAG: hypothetical protein C5B56_04700 [Proteobacteria bacterium]|nr:MAG: hypothetical protein C5B56_04700 [Pseudomonadota bacterium]
MNMQQGALHTTVTLSETARVKLREAVAAYGRGAFEEPRRCEAILRDYCPMAQKEVFLLVSALRENVAAELGTGTASIPESALIAKLTRRMSENLGISEEAALWAVESWRYALEGNPGLEGDGRGARAQSRMSYLNFNSSHPAPDSAEGGVNWPWLGMCFVAISSSMVALAAVTWLTLAHQWSTWQGGLLECAGLSAALAAAGFGQLLCARSFVQMAPPGLSGLDPSRAAFALLPEVLVLLLMPLVPVLPVIWILEWWLELHVIGIPHSAVFHVIRSFESLCLGAFTFFWLRSMPSIQGSIACSMLRRR